MFDIALQVVFFRRKQLVQIVEVGVAFAFDEVQPGRNMVG